MTVNSAILATVLYEDIFEYALTLDDLFYFLHYKKVAKSNITALLKKQHIVLQKGAYVFLKNKSMLIKKRKEREKNSKEKLQIADGVVKILRHMPTVLFIGVSGGLAMKNVKKDDDIDLFIIAQNQTVWLTRLCLLFVLQLLGYRRSYGQQKTKNAICINMLIDETALAFTKKRQTMYTAHEIMQLIPLYEKNSTYQKLLQKNAWIKNYLPNALANRVQNTKGSRTSSKAIFIFSVLNRVAKWFQFILIRRHITTETVLDNFLAFHPHDYAGIVTDEYKKRLKMYNLLHEEV
jgi:hypothetical protein